MQSLLELLPAAVAGTAGLREIQLPSFGTGVDLDLIPQTGTVSVGDDGVPVIVVSPGTSIDFTSQIPFSAEFFDSFLLDFGGSDPELSLHDWTTNPVWMASDATLNSPADLSVAADGDPALSTTLGRFVVDVPDVPGDYRLTANDALGNTSFSLTGLADPLPLRDFGDIIIRVQDVPKLAISDVTLIEGAGGEVTDVEFRVFLTGDVAGTVTVDYATDDGAALEANGDYESTSGTLEFPEGVTEQTVTVTVNGDSNIETDESFFLNLSNAAIQLIPQTSTPISDASATRPSAFSLFDQLEPVNELELRTGAVPDNRAFALEFDISGVPDGATVDSATLSFVETTDTVAEPFLADVYAYAGNADGAVTLSNPFNTLLSNQVGSVGNGSVGTDSVNVTSFIQSLVDNADSFAGFYVESLLDEYYIHSSEAVDPNNRPTLTIQFSPATVSVEISDPQAEATIRNDDTEISISDRELVEGDAGNVDAVFVLQLAQPSALDVSVSYAASAGTATADSDFQPIDGLVAFAPGQTTKSIVVHIIGDHQDEPDETFNVVLSSAVNAVLADDEGIGTIRDDDEPAVELDAPTLTSPEGTITDTTPTFIWTAVSGAESYQLAIRDKTTNTKVATPTDITTASYSTALENGHTYRWWVRAVSASGTLGEWSSGLNFNVLIFSDSATAFPTFSRFSTNDTESSTSDTNTDVPLISTETDQRPALSTGQELTKNAADDPATSEPAADAEITTDDTSIDRLFADFNESLLDDLLTV